jgi:hypothetical protein
MSIPTVSSCVVVLNQQRQEAYRHCKSCDEPADSLKQHPDKPASKNCTVVENGRVVVKPLPVEPDEANETA